MAKNEGYNGWYNYETWSVNLEFFDGMSVKDITGDDDAIDAYDLAQMMQDMVENYIDEAVQDSMLRGWLNAFVQEANFNEIAWNKIEEYE